MNDIPTTNEQNPNNNTLGNEAEVNFTALNKTIFGKVDTGATTSSLHAGNIQVNKANNSVSFSCAELSDGIITMELDGAQEVVSADAGGNMRPIIKLDVEINGIPIKSASFNLNDRSEMDSPILIGQNILKLGNFVVDVNKDKTSEQIETIQKDVQTNIDRDTKVLEAIQVLTDHNVTLSDIMVCLRTSAVNSIKE